MKSFGLMILAVVVALIATNLVINPMLAKFLAK